MARLLATFTTALAAALLLWLTPVAPVAPAWAGPVDWHELPARDEGRQWWDAGSLRVNRNGNLTVLSRFQPPPPDDKNSELYVMEIDCGQDLFRDTSINGIPQWGSSWQVAAGDGLIEGTIKAVCAAGIDLLAGS
jgi:hypothetical protein